MPYERLPTTEILPLPTTDNGVAEALFRHLIDASLMPQTGTTTTTKKQKARQCRASRRVSDGTRTRDHLDHNQELYQLSYAHRAAGESTSARAAAPGEERA